MRKVFHVLLFDHLPEFLASQTTRFWDFVATASDMEMNSQDGSSATKRSSATPAGGSGGGSRYPVAGISAMKRESQEGTSATEASSAAEASSTTSGGGGGGGGGGSSSSSSSSRVHWSGKSPGAARQEDGTLSMSKVCGFFVLSCACGVFHRSHKQTRYSEARRITPAK